MWQNISILASVQFIICYSTCLFVAAAEAVSVTVLVAVSLVTDIAVAAVTAEVTVAVCGGSSTSLLR